MCRNAGFESLESRQLLTHTTHLYDPSQGMIDSETPTAGYRSQKVELPQVSADGTITVKGTAVSDVITVERVNDPLADKDDGEYDFARYREADGSPVWSSGEIDAYVTTDWIAEERAEEQYSIDARDAAIAAGQPVPDHVTQQIADFERRIAHGENFVNKFESGHFIRITMEGVYDWFYEITDEQAAKSKIVITGGAGKDTISIAPNVPLKASVNGESGSDVLTSGRKKALLYGGNGNDRLISRSITGGTLEGGKGADRYYNRANGDVNIKGRADGDRVLSSDGTLIAVKHSGAFSTMSVSSSERKKDSGSLDGASL